MDAYKTHGAFSWSRADDARPEGRLRLLRPAVRLDSIEDDGHGHRRRTTWSRSVTRSIGGVMGMPPDAAAGMPPMWGCYVTVDDIDATARRCVELGGKVMLPARWTSPASAAWPCCRTRRAR